jgi:S-adenosylmethionine decarboxylase
VVRTHHRGSELKDLKWQAARSKQAPVRLKGVKRPRRAA